MKKFIIILVFILINMVSAQDIVEQFIIQNGEGWNITVSPWGYITFVAKERPEQIGPPIEEQEAVSTAEGFLDRNSNFFGIESVSLLDIEKSGPEQAPGSEIPYFLWVIDFEGQFYEGIPIIDTYTRVLMTIDGQIYGVGNLRYPVDESPPDSPSYSADRVVEIAKNEIDIREDPVNASLYIEGRGLEGVYDLRWKLLFPDPDNKEVVVDAMNGSILSVRSVSIPKPEEMNGLLVVVFVIVVFALVYFIASKKLKRGGK